MLGSTIRLSLMIIAIGLVLAGIVLLSLGASTSDLAGGCFFWPFPVIIACGVGLGSISFISIIVGAMVVGLVSVLFFLMVQRRTEKQPGE